MFVHGLGVSPRHLEPALRALTRDRSVWAPYLPRPRRVEELAEWVAERSPFERAVYFGNSQGCQIVVELAVRHPERVEALVLVGPTVDAGARSLVRQFARLLVDGTREPLRVNWIVVTDYLRSRPLATVRWARMSLEHRIEERLPLVRCPVVVVRGERDPIAPREWCERLATLPRGRLVEIEGAAHVAHFVAPDAVAALAERDPEDERGDDQDR